MFISRLGKKEKKEIKSIFFDLDDTLIDHKKAQNKAIMDMWSHFPAVQHLADPKVFAQAYAGVNDDLWKKYRDGDVDKLKLKQLRMELTFGKVGVTLDDWREADQVYMDYYKRYWEWMDDARESVVALSEHYDIGIMTNGFTEIQEEKFRFFSLHRYAKHLIISEEAGYLKPDSRIFEYSAGKAGYESREMLYIGDSYTSDILGGSESGWKTAWYCPEEHTDPARAEADIQFSHFSELTDYLTTPN
ncbi:YjjG family noncanonical pyrimidine nucleotidase [Balneolaceae bacterium ANBcel3]|nr:YjjG family noncanonical pyrimidine nucleotidase [Balneolaceae bacterium ANBcel3]